MNKPDTSLLESYRKALATEAAFRDQVASDMSSLASDLEERGQPGFAAAFRDMAVGHCVKALEARAKAGSPPDAPGCSHAEK